MTSCGLFLNLQKCHARIDILCCRSNFIFVIIVSMVYSIFLLLLHIYVTTPYLHVKSCMSQTPVLLQLCVLCKTIVQISRDPQYVFGTILLGRYKNIAKYLKIYSIIKVLVQNRCNNILLLYGHNHFTANPRNAAWFMYILYIYVYISVYCANLT